MSAMTTDRQPGWMHHLGHLATYVWSARTRTPRALTKIEKAHALRAELASFDVHTCRDIGLSAPDATGISSYQADLPFFMQSGFR